VFLVDTNVWLERLLDQDRAAQVGTFLEATTAKDLLMSVFAFHSIGVILARLGHANVLVQSV
jgi:hypothetical protein